MANNKHSLILRNGVKTWNQWREEYPEIIPDLSLGTFVNCDFQKANFRCVNFRGTNLSRTNMSDCDFENANFVATNLLKANLSHANLSRAIFRKAYVKECNFELSTFYETTLSSIDLTEVIGLQYCIHLGPSTIDHRTLKDSTNIPISFLQGCGLPDLLITMASNFKNKNDLYHSCFISYSTNDQDFAEVLHNDLQKHGVRCWYAPHDMKSGLKIYEQIEQAIISHDKLLLILSLSSMKSNWVMTEILNARNRELKENRKILFPIRLVSFDEIKNWSCFDSDTGRDIAKEIREYFIPGFDHWKNENSYESVFKKLLANLKVL